MLTNGSEELNGRRHGFEAAEASTVNASGMTSLGIYDLLHFKETGRRSHLTKNTDRSHSQYTLQINTSSSWSAYLHTSMADDILLSVARLLYYATIVYNRRWKTQLLLDCQGSQP